jgi:hypothetical protein
MIVFRGYQRRTRNGTDGEEKAGKVDMIVDDALRALHNVVLPRRPNMPVLSNRIGKMHKCDKTGFKIS